MGLIDTMTAPQSAFSLEFFPPKKDMPISSVYGAIEELSKYHPAFVSVTYGAGGSNRDRTIGIASYVNQTYNLETIAHLTCVGANVASIDAVLKELEHGGIKNILALRGDVPEGMSKADAFTHFRHASDLIQHIRSRDGYTIAAAAYPEGHAESASLADDIAHLKLKAEAGADFFITQLCFDKYKIENFFDKLGEAGVRAPVSVGIMPVLNPKQITRMSLLSACSIPAPLSKIIAQYGDSSEDFIKAGLAYAVDQIDYLNSIGINKFHLYTMNKAEAVSQIITDSGLAH
jgi:methylenetetrahydrofolate reductase (NADPH)